jgi:hypothetical protein
MNHESNANACEFVPEDILQLARQTEPPGWLEGVLWQWLATPGIPAKVLLDLVRTGSLSLPEDPGDSTPRRVMFSGYRGEEPYLWLIQCLPSDNNPTQHIFRRALAGRLGQVFALIASDQSLRTDLRPQEWSSLIDFAHKVCVPDALASGVMQLQRTFDSEGRLPYPADSVLTQEFIRLLGRVQPDNSLSDRWLALLSAEPDAAEKSDPTMPASLLEAWRGICLLPEAVTFGFVEDAVGRLCRAVEKRYSSDKFRRSVVEKYAAVPCVRRQMGVYRDLALASSWRGCRWLSLPDPVLFAVATIRELAFLGQLGEALSSVRDPLVPHVTAMYGEVASVLPPGSSRSWRLEVPGLSSQDSETSLSQQLMSLREMRRIIDDAQEGVALGIQVTEARAAWEMFQSTKVWQAPLGEVYKHLKRHLQQPLESRVSG